MAEEPEAVIGRDDEHNERKAPRVSTNASATRTATALHVDTPVATESAPKASAAPIEQEELTVNIVYNMTQDLAFADNRNDEHAPPEYHGTSP
jgi:hypothetical protein